MPDGAWTVWGCPRQRVGASGVQPTLNASTSHVRVPKTLLLGLGLIVCCLALLLGVEAPRRGWRVIPLPDGSGLPLPQGWLEHLARWAALNVTPLCWVGYLLTFDGLLTLLARRRGRPGISSIRARPHRFVFAWLSSIPVWCFFDWVNFRFMDAWRYHGLPELFSQRLLGYFIAFAAISPGMFLAGQWCLKLGMERIRTAPVRINRVLQVMVLLLGLAFMSYPFVVRDSVGSLTLWVSLLFLLDPVNHWLGAPSIIGDWKAGRWGRTWALVLGGATCGLLWEFWNYWALAKWTYHLPFLGFLENYRYFEMPWLGFLGFLPFGVECWVVLNSVLALLERFGLRVVEPLEDDASIL